MLSNLAERLHDRLLMFGLPFGCLLPKCQDFAIAPLSTLFFLFDHLQVCPGCAK